MIAPRSIGPSTVLGEHASLRARAETRGRGRIEIGAYCAIGQDLLVLSSNHDMRYPNVMFKMQREYDLPDLDVPEDVVIGPACWVGDRVTVLPGASIGAGCVVAAGAVVTRGTYAPFSVLGGVPARIIGARADGAVAEALVDIAWWEWPPERIRRNRSFFETDLSTVAAEALVASVVD